VSYQGASYISKYQPNTNNLPTDTSKWDLLAARGAPGGGVTDAARVDAATGAVTSITGDLATGGHTASSGVYTITNPVASNDLTTCAIVATTNAAADTRLTAKATSAHLITVMTFNNLTATDAPFSLIVSC
jgi:hypothetical protein